MDNDKHKQEDKRIRQMSDEALENERKRIEQERRRRGLHTSEEKKR